MLVCISESVTILNFSFNAKGKDHLSVTAPSCLGSGSAAKFDGTHGSISSLRNMKMIAMGRRLSPQRAFLIRIKT